MIAKKVNIDSIDKIQAFVSILNTYQGKFELVSGCAHVNAKSVMGIFSLDISQPVVLNIYNEECADHVLSEISPFTIS